MKRYLFSVVVLFILVFPALGAERLKLATTTSTENTGLLAYLLPAFEQQCGCTVDVIAVGTGQALKLGENGDADVLLVHAPELEEKFVAAGFGVNRRAVMFNDFVILGPAADPAGVREAKSAAEALAKIAAKQAPFVSRGDQSGTHVKELALWKTAGIKPEGTWYMEAGQGMGQCLTMAGEKQAYVLSDRGTYLAFREKVGLAIVHEGDAVLRNPYTVIAVSPGKHPQVQYLLSMQFIAFLTSPKGQRLIREFKDQVSGEPLFVPSAYQAPEGQ